MPRAPARRRARRRTPPRPSRAPRARSPRPSRADRIERRLQRSGARVELSTERVEARGESREDAVPVVGEVELEDAVAEDDVAAGDGCRPPPQSSAPSPAERRLEPRAERAEETFRDVAREGRRGRCGGRLRLEAREERREPTLVGLAEGFVYVLP